MNKGKKLGRGLEDISYLFLSSSTPEQGKEDPGEPIAPHDHASSPPLIFSLCSCMPITSYIACNLALEMAKLKRSVSVLDLNGSSPTIRHLMGNLVDLQDQFPNENNSSRRECKIESIKLYGFAKITIISSHPLEKGETLSEVMERVFSSESTARSDIILLHLPRQASSIFLPPLPSIIRKTIFIVDDSISSLLAAYAWIKILVPLCQCYLVGNLDQREADDSSPLLSSWNFIEKLQSTAALNLPAQLTITSTTPIIINQEALDSIRLRRPLALVESSSMAGASIEHLCQALLGEP